MKEVKINSWADFVGVVSEYKFREWLYRGQSDSKWKLESSLLRTMKQNIKLRSSGKKRQIYLTKEKYEQEVINSFRKSAHLYINSFPEKNNSLDWLSIMQHHGAPTRLLDFSFSPYVALFFAVSGIKDSGSVYCIKHNEIFQTDEGFFKNISEKYDEIIKPNKKKGSNFLMPYEPTFTNMRLMAQQGAFLVPNSLEYSHEEILNNYGLGDDCVRKLIINQGCAFDIIENLAKMNITASNLFPGLDGFCRSFETIGIIPISRLRPINGK